MNPREKHFYDRVGGNYFIYRPPTPPYVRFRIRRFFSFHRLLDNSRVWMYIPAWLLFFFKDLVQDFRHFPITFSTIG